MVFMSCNSLGHRHYWSPLMELRLTWALILVMMMALDATPQRKKLHRQLSLTADVKWVQLAGFIHNNRDQLNVPSIGYLGGLGGWGGVCSTQASGVCGTLLSRHPKSCGRWPHITKPRLHTLGHGTLGSVFSFSGVLFY